MIFTARMLTLLAVISFLGGCGHRSTPAPDSVAPGTTTITQLSRVAPTRLQLSPRRLVGRVLSVNAQRGFVFIKLDLDSPPAASREGTELIVRTDDLRETARLRSTAYSRGRILGASLISGRPTPGDEVVFLLREAEH